MSAAHRPRVLIVAGYFDWLSGYQETALAAAYAEFADVEVVSSDRVSPGFSDEHLARIGVPRRYPVGTTAEHGIRITRLSTHELRSIVWSRRAVEEISGRACDLLVQVMPGHGLPVAASLSRQRGPRAVLYGDNWAMYAHLGPRARALKWAVFSMTKGLVYKFVNRRATVTYGYTENTLDRLRAFRGRTPMELLPLGYAVNRFYLDGSSRTATRSRLGLAPDDVVLVAAGKYTPHKRLDWVLAAFEEAARTRPGLRLLVAGLDDSPAGREFVARIRRSVAADRIVTLGFLDAPELNAVYNAGDLAIWPRYPAITIQQAMGTGLPVVLPRNDLVGHLVRPGDETGLYFDLRPGNEEAAVTSAVEAALRHFDLSSDARALRRERNAWLASDSLARKVLADAGAAPKEVAV